MSLIERLLNIVARRSVEEVVISLGAESTQESQITSKVSISSAQGIRDESMLIGRMGQRYETVIPAELPGDNEGRVVGTADC